MTEDTELKAMAAAAKALDEVEEEDARVRVLQWVNSRYGKGKLAPPAGARTAQGGEVEEEAIADVAALYTMAGPTTDPERALVVGYWFQVHENNKDIDAQSVNTALKHLGNPISNITSAFSSLMERKPSLVMQVQKKGKTRQARKRYRLTTAGLQAVRRMLSGETEEDAAGS